MAITCKEDLLGAMELAGNGCLGTDVYLDLVRQQGKDVKLIDKTDESFSLITEELFIKNRESGQEMARQLGLGKVPDTWEEFQEIIDDLQAKQGLIRIYRLNLPTNWNLGHLALVPVPEQATFNYLPGLNLCGFGRQVSMNSKGPRLYCRAIFYTTMDVSPFWLGLQMYEAACTACDSLAEKEKPVYTKEARRFIQRMREQKVSISIEESEQYLKALSIVERVIDFRLDNKLQSIIDSFMICPDGKKLYKDELMNCTEHLIKVIEKKCEPTKHVLDKVFSYAMITKIIMKRILSEQLFQQLLIPSLPLPYVQI